MKRPALLGVLLLAACCPQATPHAVTIPSPDLPKLTAPPLAAVDLATLTEGQVVHGFRTTALYLDDADQPIGARFVHVATGFVFDYLRIESAPQGFLWVNSFPTSDKGEPHTQEHLLLGKGDRGRKLGSAESMALATSSAFTAQWRTAYHFHTVAGPDVFWDVFADQLDATLHPDYTDEEIRREVRNFGVEKADDGTLHLEEKGTVYNEMVRAYESPDAVLWRNVLGMVYGPSHPLAYEAGGYPEAIRTMTAQDIRAFHDRAYHLPNMGVIGAFPHAMALADVLDHTATLLDHEADAGGKAMSLADLPAPSPAPAGSLRVVDYPFADAGNPGQLALAWPAARPLDETEHTLLGLFLDAFAGDESTVLYKQLIDSKTRVMDLGASGLGTMLNNDQGEAVTLAIAGVKADHLDEPTLRAVRQLVRAELDRLAALPDGDPALLAFDQRVRSRVTDLRRRLAKFLDSPPGFGVRGTGSGWMDHLQLLSKTAGFKKSLTLRGSLAAIEQLLAAPTNPWRSRLATWGLLAEPFGVAARPSPTARKAIDEARDQRVAAELTRLQGVHHAADAAAALAAYQRTYDATTATLEQAAAATALPPLVKSAPRTLDDGIAYQAGTVGGVASFAATFDSMTSARVELDLAIDGQIAPGDQLFLAALPTLLHDAGVIDGGAPIAADELRERLRREVLELSVGYAVNPRTRRLELSVAGAGAGVVETQHAVAWMRRLLLAPDWRVDNLPRLRDLLEQELTGLRQRMLGSEEGWVEDPRDAWWLQRWTAYVHAASFLTRAHDLHRLRWMLEDPQDAKARAEAVAFLTKLADAKALPRAELLELAHALAGAPTKRARLAPFVAAAGKLSAKAAPIARDAGKDLTLLLGDLPDATLAADWSYLCHEMASDLAVTAPTALARLAAVRAAIAVAPRARLVVVGSAANQRAIAADLVSLAAALPTTAPAATAPREVPPPFVARLRDHAPAGAPVFVGLFAPGTSSGVFLDLAPATSYADTSDAAVLDYLASNLYTGHGAHSIFMKTWAAGLAYSNGLHPKAADGTLDYYAERCPLLPQTIRFVIDQLRKATPDPSVARYAIAKAFDSRIAGGYEQRASAMAADLVDGQTPEVVRAFRAKLLAQADRPTLTQELFARMPTVYAKVLPGLGAIDPAGTYFVIGPDKQLAAYQDYLHAAVGKDATLHRLYPRDFWIPAP
jgi:Zn-dependent M16 (insulinase) family peptidase